MDRGIISVENPVVLILAQTPAKARRWAEMIRPVAKQILLSVDEVTDELQPEIVVTDSAKWDGAECGVIRIGQTGPADMLMPEQTTERELQLTCRLLGNIVRLRWREHRIAELQRHWQSEAFTDPLTGLYNRRAWDAELKERLENFPAADQDNVKPAESKAFLCLAIFDLDNLKRINDTFGHLAGDEVLKHAAKALRESLRPDDFVARLGGDEFGLLFWLPNAEIAQSVIERVRATVPRQLERAGMHVATASVGYRVVGRGDSPESLSSLFGMADAALRRAKESGRNWSVQEK
ncbi:MAG: GGDEF domain-containing protein [Pirellulales bacterium]|nr:GGDEF domain-containing protein [Pirellulales bacterium]